MSGSDLRCDRCGAGVSGPAGAGSPGPTSGVRFSYHPGDLSLRDDSGLLCGSCWTALDDWLGPSRMGACAVCAERVGRYQSLHVRRSGQPGGWQLCAPHAADFLNGLLTVQPKFDRDSFRLPLDGSGAPGEAGGG